MQLPCAIKSMNKYDLDMGVERVTVSLEADLASAVRAAADADRENVSSWLAVAARKRLAARGLKDVVDEWEAEHGQFTRNELEHARAKLNG